MSAITFEGPRWTERAWNLAMDGAGEWDGVGYAIPVDYDDVRYFPELKGWRFMWVAEIDGKVVGRTQGYADERKPHGSYNSDCVFDGVHHEQPRISLV